MILLLETIKENIIDVYHNDRAQKHLLFSIAIQTDIGMILQSRLFSEHWLHITAQWIDPFNQNRGVALIKNKLNTLTTPNEVSPTINKLLPPINL